PYTLTGEIAGRDMAPRAMAAAGWGTADLARRQELALDWLSQIDGLHTLRADDAEDAAAFKREGKSLPPPESEATPEGGIKVRYWTGTGNGGMARATELRCSRHETTFGPDGTEKDSTTLDHFVHKLGS